MGFVTETTGVGGLHGGKMRGQENQIYLDMLNLEQSTYCNIKRHTFSINGSALIGHCFNSLNYLKIQRQVSTAINQKKH